MAAITQTVVRGTNGPITVTRTALTGTDSLVYVQNSGQVLELYNTTASPVTVTIDGSTSSTISPPGYGGTVDVSAGKAIVVGASATVAVRLDTISAFLSGVVAVTGGTGVTAHLYQV